MAPGRAVEVRTGLHSGPVFRFADVNENPNFAGDGINQLARVLDVGDAWHIISSRAGFDAFGATNSEFREWFYRIGAIKVKHEVEVEMFNVWDEAAQIGNYMPPVV